MAEKKKVLIVDDDEGMRALMSTIVRRLGHDVTVGENSTEAIQLIRCFTFDLVFMDFNMPGPDGRGLNGVQTVQLIVAQADQHPTKLPVFILATTDAPDFSKPPANFVAVTNKNLAEIEECCKKYLS